MPYYTTKKHCAPGLKIASLLINFGILNWWELERNQEGWNDFYKIKTGEEPEQTLTCIIT